MSHKIGLHWIRTHPDGQDYAHIEAMQYPSVKLFEWHWSDRDACHDLLSVLPKQSYILARDHPLSEQKQDMWHDPEGTGIRHANEWAMKVAQGRVHTPVERTFFLGVNEPDATTGDRDAIDRYTAAFLGRLQVHGLRGGAFNFSTGHPRTVDGTPNTPADYSVFERSHQAIVRGHHIAVAHIYGTGAVPCAPGHYDRLAACDWTDVEWVIGEFGIDEHVIGGGAHAGFHQYFNGHLEDYCGWLDMAILGINDPRIHSYQVFTYDFSHPWDSFDVRPIRHALESYPWRHAQIASKPVQTHLPTVSTGPKPTSKPVAAWIIAPAGAFVRNAPVTGEVLTAIPYGEQVRIVGVDNPSGWFRVQAGDREGWMAPHLVSVHAPEPKPQPPTTVDRGDVWPRIYAFVKKWEGGWADNPNDPGGATNRGVTIGTFIRWRESRGLPTPTKDDLRNLTDAEAEQIFYEWYYKASGADKLPWPLALVQTDTAVNAGVGRAEEMLRKSGGNFLAYMGHLIIWYVSIDGFEHFGRAWMKRRGDLLLAASA